MVTQHIRSSKGSILGAVVLVAIFGALLFLPTAPNTVSKSSEVGFVSLSPNGVSGGAIIPASCESGLGEGGVAHFVGDTFGNTSSGCGALSGSLSINPNTCAVSSKGSTCSASLTWNTINPVSGRISEVTRDNLANTSVFNGNSGTNQPITVPFPVNTYPKVTYYLYHNLELAKKVFTFTWSGSKVTPGPLVVENVISKKITSAIESAPVSLWKMLSAKFIQTAKAAVVQIFSNQPLKLSSTIINVGPAVSIKFTNAFYIDIGNDNDALQPGVKDGWDKTYLIPIDGILADTTVSASQLIPEGLPAGTHAIIFCTDVDEDISEPGPNNDPVLGLATRCNEKIAQAPYEDFPLPIASLTALPNPIAYNDRSMLTWWSSTDATSCTAGGPWSNSSTFSGNGLTNELTINTPFTFQCEGPGGTSLPASVTVNVNSAPASTPITTSTTVPKVEIRADSNSIVDGGSTKLKWRSTNTSSCTSAEFITSDATSNDSTGVSVSPRITTYYTITCPGTTSGSAIDSVSVSVLSLSSPDSSLSAYPTRVKNTEYTKIKATASNVDSCTLRKNGIVWLPILYANAYKDVSASPSEKITIQTTYTLTCTTTGTPPSVKSVTVNVIPVFQEF